MKYIGNNVKDLKIAYIGGGSRGWAWGLMSDLVAADDISGEVRLYDICREAAEHNKIIGNKFNNAVGAKSHWNYVVSDTLKDALVDADFVVISILPGTFDEMESDVHTPEKYGIYQSVGDSIGAGGLVRALRTIPMYETIAEAIKNYSPKAWVINYTNPMTVCVRTLYRVFPEIKAFGCCHEVFGTQKMFCELLKEFCNIQNVEQHQIKINVLGVNHFTWINEAYYKDIDLLNLYSKFVEKYYESGYGSCKDDNWLNNNFDSAKRVQMDLFKKFGYIAAAGDRHIAEFVNNRWYLGSVENVSKWKFGLTSVQWRKDDLEKRLEKSRNLISGKEEVTIKNTGEDGVNQIRSLLGLTEIVTNVNLPNYGQIPNLPLGAVVETNAIFRANQLKPIFAGNIPFNISPMISRISTEQEMIVEAGLTKDLKLAYQAFISDAQMYIPLNESKELFDKMIEKTKEYLKMYF